MDLDLTCQAYGPVDVITCAGELDVYTAHRLRELLIGLCARGRCWLVMDLDGLTFLDHTGLGVMVGALKDARKHDGQVDIVCTQERIAKIFWITGLTRVFCIYDTAEAAVAGLRELSQEQPDA